jgi:serine/threonine protein phosphatase PrpC
MMLPRIAPGSNLAPDLLKGKMCTLASLQVTFGMAETRGRRPAMEDALCKEHWVEPLRIGDDTSNIEFLMLGVCDGHVDKRLISKFVASNIPGFLRKIWKEMSDEGVDVDMSSEVYWNAVWTKTCITLDAELKKEELFGGTTGVFALISTELVVVANVGDSRCILVQDEGKNSLASTVTPLSFDHKPRNPVECQRVTNAGLKVENKESIVLEGIGGMTVSRAFGDFEFKANDKLGPEGQAVSCIPDVIVHKRDEKDTFLILATDGVWDVMSNKDVKDLVVEQVKIKTKTGLADTLLPDVGETLLDTCYRKCALDNMSTIVVSLSPKAVQVLSSGDELPSRTASDLPTM